MHEMSLCEGIIQIIEDSAATQSFNKVKSVWLEVGTLAGVEIPALKFCFDVVCRNTIAEGSDLHIVETPAVAWCMWCSESVLIKQRHDACPKCDKYQLQVTSGDEMRIKELEVA